MTLYKLIPPLRFMRHLRYHRYILKHLKWKAQDESRLRFYQELITAGDLIFDVGANMGNRSKIFRKLGTEVIAFEPQSYCAEFLSVAFLDDPDFVLVKAALSNYEGKVEMHLGEAHTLSTIDTNWIARMQSGGRFSEHKWAATEMVDVTTLDKSIQNFGVPAFIKIDVEGHEFNVVRGLTQPVKLLSLEFASEALDNIHHCIDHLDSLAKYEYRLSLGESMHFEGSAWCNGPEIKALLTRAKEIDPLVWGDIYARRVQ